MEKLDETSAKLISAGNARSARQLRKPKASRARDTRKRMYICMYIQRERERERYTCAHHLCTSNTVHRISVRVRWNAWIGHCTL